jgi:hypothetical protein
MKKITFLIGVLFLAGTAHAQVAAVSINQAGGLTPANGIHSGDSNKASNPNSSARNDGEYIISTFENYQQAVATGEQELKAKTPQLAEIARSVRAEKKTVPPKSVIVADQDVEGKMTISRQKQEPEPARTE